MSKPSARAIFDEALELPPQQRTAHVATQCSGDAALEAKVESLLAAYDNAEGFLAGTKSPTVAALHEGPGVRIGVYKLLQLIGEGGFGSVFLAEQDKPVVRRVGLKIIKLGMDTKAVIARFEAERQALAMMDHPNIAKVFDAGATDTGRPYFVMELVKGEPVTQYCDKNSLSIAQRLDLFVQVCHAVQHAHQKGVIHRDIKPNNILVSTQDGIPLAKVIDFGIAKATVARLTEKTLFTEHHQLIGTPEYMSPEQADGSMDIDTRTDVYSLGVLLYELLTGATPFDPKKLRSAAFAEIQRIIREDEPQKPSTRLSHQTATLASVAAHRHADAASLPRMLRGDLDWIVMKALEKDRARRYETANALVMDIERHLRHEPVAASPPSQMYRLRKFVRRNRVAVVAGLIIGLALVLGVIGTSTGMIWALGERTRANEAWQSEAKQRQAAQKSEERTRTEAERARTALGLLSEMVQRPQTQDETGKPLTFVDQLHKFASTLAPRVEGQPEIEAHVRSVLGRAYSSVEAFTAAAEQFERVVAIRRALGGELDPAVSAALWDLTGAVLEGGDKARATEIGRAAVDQARLSASEHLEIAERLHILAQIQYLSDDSAAAEISAREGLQMRERLLGPNHVLVAGAHTQLAAIATRRREWTEAERHYVESAAIYRKANGELSAGRTWQEIRLAEMLRLRGEYARAVQVSCESIERVRLSLAREVSPVQRLAFAEQLEQLASLLNVTQENWPEMEAVARDALEIRRELRTSDPLAFARSAGQLAGILWCRGNFAEAERLCREAMTVVRTSDQTRYQFGTAVTTSLLQIVLRDGGGDLAEAQSLAEESLAASRKAHSEPYWTVWMLEYELALILRLRGNDAEARPLEQHAAALIPRADAYRSLGVALRCQRVGEALVSRGEYELAEPVLGERQRILRDLGPQHWLRFDAMSVLGECFAAQGRFMEAETALLESTEHLRQDAAAPPDRLHRAVERVIGLYEAWHAAEPDRGYDARAAQWQAALNAGAEFQEAPPSN